MQPVPPVRGGLLHIHSESPAPQLTFGGMPSRTFPDIPRGWIIPIGGRLLDREILTRFIELSGGEDARIAIIPTASREPEMGEYYELVFGRHGVRNSKSLR